MAAVLNRRFARVYPRGRVRGLDFVHGKVEKHLDNFLYRGSRLHGINKCCLKYHANLCCRLHLDPTKCTTFTI